MRFCLLNPTMSSLTPAQAGGELWPIITSKTTIVSVAGVEGKF